MNDATPEAWEVIRYVLWAGVWCSFTLFFVSVVLGVLGWSRRTLSIILGAALGALPLVILWPAGLIATSPYAAVGGLSGAVFLIRHLRRQHNVAGYYVMEAIAFMLCLVALPTAALFACWFFM